MLLTVAAAVAVWLWPGGETRRETAGSRGRSEAAGKANGEAGLFDFLFSGPEAAEADPARDDDPDSAGVRDPPKAGAVVSGQVLRAEDGIPIMGARISGRMQDPQDWTPFDERKAEFRAATDDDGRYRIAGVPEGNLFLRATAPDLAAADRELELDAFELRRGVDFLMVEAGSVSGRIIERDGGAPVEGFLVLGVSPLDKGGRNATSDDTGHYRIEGLMPGRNIVIPRPGSSEHHVPGGFQRMFREVEVRPGQEVRGIDFEVRRGAAVTGRVTAGPDRPLRGAMVHVRQRSGGRDFFGMAETDADGRYRVGGLPPGAEARASVRHKDYVPAEADVTLPEAPGAAATLDVTLRRACVATGRVVDVDGEPLPGAEVTAVAQKDPEDEQAGATRSWRIYADSSAVADDEGRFELKRLFAERYTLRARMGGWAGQVEGPEIRCGEDRRVTDLELVLEPPEGGEISGRVMDSVGQPVPDAVVGTRARHGSPLWKSMRAVKGALAAKTDLQGRFRLVGLKGEALDLTASHPFYAEARLEQVPVGAADVVLTMKSLGALRGRVTVEGDLDLPRYFNVRTCPGEGSDARLACLQRGGRLVFSEHKSKLFGAADEGRFELRDLAPGPTVVVVEAEGYRPGATEATVPDGGAVEGVEVRLAAGASVSGLVVDGRSRPVAGALVRAVEETEDNRDRLARGFGSVFHEGRVAHSAEDGSFRLTGLRGGRYWLAAQHADFAPAMPVPVEVPERGELPGLRLELPDGGSVVGRITEGGQPLRGAAVMLAGRAHNSSVATDQDGRFGFEQLPAGGYSLMINPGEEAEFIKLPVEVREGEETRRDVELGALGRVRGAVTGRRPDTVLLAFLRQPGSARAGGEALEPAERARRDFERSAGFDVVKFDGRGNGSFRIENVPPGPYVLELIERPMRGPPGRAGPVASDERSVIWRDIEVPAGGEVAVELTVEAGDREE